MMASSDQRALGLHKGIDLAARFGLRDEAQRLAKLVWEWRATNPDVFDGMMG